MRIAYITSGAAGMFCGSCMRDNTLVAALNAQGHEALLIPTYTPIRTDEADVSQRQVFFGGINVYLQQKSALFRKTPWFIDRLLNGRRLLNWVSRFAVRTQAQDLGELTISMLRGEHGRQKKEFEKLLRFLETSAKPGVIHLSNVLISGMAAPLKDRLRTPLLATLQGDDIFLESLPGDHKSRALDLIRGHCRLIDGFVATSHYYADFMAGYLDIPRARIDVIYPGLNLRGHGALAPRRNGQPFTIGYFARICPEKGLHLLVEAFHHLKQLSGTPPCRLRISGWLGEHNRWYFDQQRRRLRDWGYAGDADHVEAPDHAAKVRFLQSLDVLSVPTTYREPKGLYILEALANGVPVVQPRHGSFPELVEATGGGLLIEPENPIELAHALRRLMDRPEERREMAERGKKAVHERFHAGAMAEATLGTYRKYLS
ncbi:MAG: glycosyltransferase family 4 protein [Planctomycetes bacterium]|nr:glycosyltransferase family 4 protein [Planctomycetota bacterium]